MLFRGGLTAPYRPGHHLRPGFRAGAYLDRLFDGWVCVPPSINWGFGRRYPYKARPGVDQCATLQDLLQLISLAILMSGIGDLVPPSGSTVEFRVAFRTGI